MMDPKTILVVDDSPDNRIVFGAFLEASGFIVFTAENGQEGVLRAREIHPDLVLMDVAMPVMDGLEATDQLKADRDTAMIPVLILTASDSTGIRLQAQQAGCDGFLPKPIAAGRILNEVHRLLSLTPVAATRPGRGTPPGPPRDRRGSLSRPGDAVRIPAGESPKPGTYGADRYVQL